MHHSAAAARCGECTICAIITPNSSHPHILCHTVRLHASLRHTHNHPTPYIRHAPQGNRAGVVGCGFWNNNCGGLDLTTVWQIVYCIIAGLVVVVFPFFIFYYENDDEGMQAESESGGSCFRQLIDMRNFKRSFCAALCYTLVTTGIAAIVIGVSYRYLSTSYLPYVLEGVDVGNPTAWQPNGERCCSTHVFCTSRRCIIIIVFDGWVGGWLTPL